MSMRRREFLEACAAGLVLLGAGGCATTRRRAAATRTVAVVGGGYGGATAARYIRQLDPSIRVILVEPNETFVSCPMSNTVLGGFRRIAELTFPYAGLSRFGVEVVRDAAAAIDVERRQVRLARGDAVPYDRVVVSPGVEFIWEALPGLGAAEARALIPHAWKAGAQTVALRRQLEAMPDGGVYVLAVPEAPYRCPPGPYERACQVAAYFKAAKPRSKVVVLDANGDVVSKAALFKRAWSDLYPGLVEYRPGSAAVDVDARGKIVKLEFEEVKGDVVNVVPPMKAGAIAAPFITANGRWCEVDWITYESKAAPGVHVLGDSLLSAPAMPKSASMANGQAKVCAAAIVALLGGEAPNPAPTLINTCYSMVSDRLAIHVASVHKYDEQDRTMKAVPGAGGVSSSMSEAEGAYAMNWARNIWADTLG
jgi:NADPH-dependent 2,4-dienoyl-CoA reductase/sulfur reductase-like enzyme